jgi:hypothetical protein
LVCFPWFVFCCSAVLLLTASMHVCGACTHKAAFSADCLDVHACAAHWLESCWCKHVQPAHLSRLQLFQSIRCSLAMVTASAALAAWFVVVAGRAAGNCKWLQVYQIQRQTLIKV